MAMVDELLDTKLGMKANETQARRLGKENKRKQRSSTKHLHILGIRMHIFASRQCADYAHSSYGGADEGAWHLLRLL